MIDLHAASIAFTFYVHSIGTDGYVRAVGLTAEAARAAIADEGANPDDGFTVTMTCAAEHAHDAVYSLFATTHGPKHAEDAWLSLNIGGGK